jgi:adenosylmethionine-8-amino-7-oxononanoate aminotransferase
MSMTKKEQAEFDRVVDELRLVAALRWTEAPAGPDVPPPSAFGLTLGYLPIAVGSDSARVSEACSSAVSHGLTHTKTTTQHPMALYSTRLMALRALRHKVELRCARQLADIDKQITAAKETA